MAKRHRKSLRISETTYRSALDRAIDVIFEVASERWTLEELAAHAHLHYSTVYRLWSRTTKYPRWQTFWKLAAAVGLSIEFTDPATRRVIYRQGRSKRLKIAA
jgi:AraC-like DNA-binding protein